jgi:uncharacterized Ntn-hydrolase superfamily protein
VNATRKSTFSIVAADLAAGEVGCAVQSRYFSVGSVVPWVRAGIGACATQAAGVAVFGERALVELDRGATPEEALERVLADDDGRETRQLGLVTADGRAAAFTGSACNDWAGHRLGAGFAVQGNILAGEAVVDEMARAFEKTVGPLVHRLVAALEAGQAAGGDRRGQQSAAVVVERTGARSEAREGIDRVCDLRVEDHEQPIAELRRLVGIWTSWEAMRRANGRYERGDYAGAADVLLASLGGGEAPEPGVLYNLACYESLAGRGGQAVEHLRQALERDDSLRALVPSDSDFDPVREQVSQL